MPLRRSPSRHRRASTHAARAVIVMMAAGSLFALAPVSEVAAAPRASCTARAGNGRYVAYVFGEVLGRCPDARALAYWTNRLDQGLARWAFADAVDGSTENLRRNNVEPMYQQLLGRVPTSAERDAWVATLRRDRRNAEMTALLLASPEGYALHTDGAAGPADRDLKWVTYAYNRILDRRPDPEGLSFYLRRFAPTGSTTAERVGVAMALERSTANATSWTKAVFAEALGRPGTAWEVTHWRAWLIGPNRWQTFRYWTRILATDEAYRVAQHPAG